MIRIAISLFSMMLLAGCMTVTGAPREENVVYNETSTEQAGSALSDSVSLGEVSEFPGMSVITLSFKTNPNLDDDEFKEFLRQSLDNAGLLGEGYVLDAKLVDSDNWGLGFDLGLGELTRNLAVEYTLKNPDNEVVYSEVIVGDGEITNYNFFWPYHLIEREAAEKGYKDNIRQLIEELKSYET
ncbi:MAG: hypothetical protein HLX50_17815 [Alteromonadaceae bacterium]|nr:hypothetical protein [Alteromonadaceae bacterium]